jgi:sulfite reductase (ferredoxin)
VVRNVTGCPLAGLDRHELIDAAPLALEIAHCSPATRVLQPAPQVQNLRHRLPLLVQLPGDQRHRPHRRQARTARSATPSASAAASPPSRTSPSARRLHSPDQAVPVVRAVAEIFRDQQGLRESRDRARIKYLFLRKEGWTAEKLPRRARIRLDFKLLPGVPEQVPDDIFRDHVGVTPQRQPGLSSVGASVLAAASAAISFGSRADLPNASAAALRTTVSQNLLFIDVPNAGPPSSSSANSAKSACTSKAPTFWRGAIACTGTEFCKLAITETKGFTRWLVDELEERLPGFDQQLKLNVTGCPNGCGQHWVADIGIEGKKIKHDGKLTDAYYFCLGGAVGQHAAVARPVGYRCPAPLVPEAIERLLRQYLADRVPNENLRAWFSRIPNDELRAHLAGEALAPVERDLPTGRVPHGVAD